MNKTARQLIEDATSFALPLDDEGYLPEGQIVERSFARLVKKISLEPEPFAILSAMKGEYGDPDQYDDPEEKKLAAVAVAEDRRNSRALLSILNQSRLGPFILRGTYLEGPNRESPSVARKLGLPLIQKEEVSYFVTSPQDWPEDQFRAVILNLIKKFDQWGAIYGDGTGRWGELNQVGAFDASFTRFTIGKVGDAYSELLRRRNVKPGQTPPVKRPFRFEDEDRFRFAGLVEPRGNERFSFINHGISWLGNAYAEYDD